ncbi:hypothetical protein [Corallibacter sp.]|uniref:hypothetical protein n=1 Tax=Corallibacter sp. TaxID=2038084 RepID=UPI003A8CDA17
MRLVHTFNSGNGTTQTFRLTNNIQKLVFIDVTAATDFLSVLNGLKIKANITTPNQNDAVMISKQPILLPVLISSEMGGVNYSKAGQYRYEVLLTPNGSLALNNDNAYIDVELTSSIAATNIKIYSDESPIVGKVFNTYKHQSLLSGSKTLNVANIYALCVDPKNFVDTSLRYANGIVDNLDLLNLEFPKQKSISKLAYDLEEDQKIFNTSHLLLPLKRDGINVTTVDAEITNDTKYTSLQLTQYLS